MPESDTLSKKKKHLNSLIFDIKPINSRLVAVTLNGQLPVTIITAFAPTAENDLMVK